MREFLSACANFLLENEARYNRTKSALPRATGVENRRDSSPNNFFVVREWAHWIRRKKLVLMREKSLGKAQGGRELRGSKL